MGDGGGGRWKEEVEEEERRKSWKALIDLHPIERKQHEMTA